MSIWWIDLVSVYPFKVGFFFFCDRHDITYDGNLSNSVKNVNMQNALHFQCLSSISI